MNNPLSQIFRFILKLVFALSAAVLAVGLLLVALTVFALSMLKYLITGRKPAPLMAFSQFRKFSQTGMWTGSFSRHPSTKAASGQVIDVEARELQDERRES
ncbi:MAG: hypothetical protein ABI642_03810 [Polaromonas sp.]